MQEYITPHFALVVKQKAFITYMDLDVFGSHVNTSQLNTTVELLKKNLPSIFMSKCFNEKNLPFFKEVENTEIGHLFEHILLEFLYEIKKGQGRFPAIHNGITKWNWVLEKRGTFHIEIDCGIEDREILTVAIEKSIALVERVLNQVPINSRNIFPDTLPFKG